MCLGCAALANAGVDLKPVSQSSDERHERIPGTQLLKWKFCAYAIICLWAPFGVKESPPLVAVVAATCQRTAFLQKLPNAGDGYAQHNKTESTNPMNQSKLRQHSDEHAFTPNHIFSATLSSYSTLSYGTLSHFQLRLILVAGRSLTSTVSATTSLSTRCDSEIVCGTCVCMLLVMSDMMTPEMHLRLFVCFDGSNDMT